MEETALVFLPSLFLAMTSMVSESQTKIKGLDPREPVTTNFLLGQTPKDMISSVWPLTLDF